MPRQRRPAGAGNQGGYQGTGNPGGGGGIPSPALAPGQPYGQNAQLAAATAVVPTAAVPPSPSASPLPPAPGTPQPPAGAVAGGNQPPTAGGNPVSAALAAALAASPPPQGGLTRPSERPLEPVTTGLTSGDGPGPEILGQTPNPVVATLSRIADLSGDPFMAQIADRARGMSGGQ